jgi:hypothetical protein
MTSPSQGGRNFCDSVSPERLRVFVEETCSQNFLLPSFLRFREVKRPALREEAGFFPQNKRFSVVKRYIQASKLLMAW